MKLFKSNFSFFRCLLAVASIFCITSCSSPDEENTIVGSNSAKVEADDYSKIADKLLLYKDGWASLQSTAPKGANWFTDCSETDTKGVTNGKKFRNAIDKYHAWIRVERPLLVKSGQIAADNYDKMPTITSAKQAEIKSCLDNTAYSSSEKDIIVKQIILKYADWFKVGKGVIANIPDDQETLKFLRIRQQCFETIQSIVSEAIPNKTIPSQSTTSANSYTNYLLKNINNIRAGMFLYHKKFNHVSGIQSVARDINNKLYVTVVESNWSDVWKNPTGQNPFQRTISIRTSTHTEKINGKNVTVGKINLDDYYIVKINKDNL